MGLSRRQAKPPGTASGALDADVRRVDPDRWLASRFIGDRAARADVVALYAFDHELARAAKAASNALIAEIRLTWWREAVDEIFAGAPARGHPAARALALAVARHGLPRGPLDAMIEARLGALDGASLTLETAIAWADAVGGSATSLAALVLDPLTPGEAVAPAGRAWGLGLLRRSGLAEGRDFDDQLGATLDLAGRAAQVASARAFPALAAVTLLRDDLRGRSPGEIARRLRLVWAVLRGRI